MNATRIVGTTMLLALLAGCEDELTKYAEAPAPPMPQQGVQAFIQVDNADAMPGQEVRVRVQVQVGSEMTQPLASYTGRLHFDVDALTLVRDIQIDDGLRVVNSNGASEGEIRFAGAQAGGLAVLTLYEGVFTVQEAGFTGSLALQVEEMSAADLTDYREMLDVDEEVYVRRAGS